MFELFPIVVPLFLEVAALDLLQIHILGFLDESDGPVEHALVLGDHALVAAVNVIVHHADQVIAHVPDDKFVV